MKVDRIQREGDSLVVVIRDVNEKSIQEDLDLAMERRIRGSKVLETLLVVCSASTGEELLRAPLGDPCDYQELDAVLDTTSRTLTVTVNLKPGQDPSESDAESMRTATSELDPAVDLRIGTQTPAPAAASSVPTTPLQSDEGETMNSEDSHADGAAAAGEAEDDGQATKKKKKKKNKKKKKATATGSEAAEVEADAADGSDDGDNKANADSAIHAAQPASETLDHPAQEDKEKENQEASEGIAAATVAPMETEVELLPPAAPATFELGKEVPHRPLSGPHIKDALSKDGAKDKREDKWLVKPFNAWSIDSQAGEASFGAWGIFDGHGGRQVATYASNSLLKFVAEGAAASPQLSSSAGPPAGSPELPLPEVRGLAPEDAAEWMAQAELVRRLPTALKSAFAQCNAEAQRRFKEGGTTATLAVSCGWELLVANVGDSCAYLDTGAEVLAVTTTHRLQDSPAEVARIEASGGEVARSTVDGVPAGPIRVWPGGLAMARSIGDVDAGERVTAEPEICQVSIPLEGARLIIGSDGLWDAIHPKTAAHHTREMPAAEAAHRLLALAIKKDKLKDDVTVVVVDFLPKVDDRLPPALSKHRATAGKKAAEVPKVAHVWHPLQPGELGDHLAAGAARRQAVLDEAAAEEEAQRAEEARRKELKVRAAEEAASRAVRSGPAAVSGLYAELAHLTLTPADIEAALAKETKKMHKQQQQLKEEAQSGEWHTVSEGKNDAAVTNKHQRKPKGGQGQPVREGPGKAPRAGDKHAEPNEQSAHDAAPTSAVNANGAVERPQEGGRRGRGRQGRGGALGGRGTRFEGGRGRGGRGLPPPSEPPMEHLPAPPAPETLPVPMQFEPLPQRPPRTRRRDAKLEGHGPAAAPALDNSSFDAFGAAFAPNGAANVGREAQKGKGKPQGRMEAAAAPLAQPVEAPQQPRPDQRARVAAQNGEPRGGKGGQNAQTKRPLPVPVSVSANGPSQDKASSGSRPPPRPQAAQNGPAAAGEAQDGKQKKKHRGGRGRIGPEGKEGAGGGGLAAAPAAAQSS